MRWERSRLDIIISEQSVTLGLCILFSGEHRSPLCSSSVNVPSVLYGGLPALKVIVLAATRCERAFESHYQPKKAPKRVPFGADACSRRCANAFAPSRSEMKLIPVVSLTLRPKNSPPDCFCRRYAMRTGFRISLSAKKGTQTGAFWS